MRSFGKYVSIGIKSQAPDSLGTLTRDSFARLFNAADIPVFVKDRRHRWLFLNEKMVDLLGVSREILLGRTDHDVFPHHQADIYWRRDEGIFKSGQPHEQEEFYATKSGKTITILIRKRIVSLPDGAKVMLGFIYDVSALRAAELELRRSQAKLRRIEGIAREYIWETDNSGAFVFLSDSVHAVLGFSAQQLVGRTMMSLSEHSEAERLGSWLSSRSTRGELMRDLLHVATHCSGHRVWLRLSGCPVIDENGSVLGVRGTAIDVTQQAQIELAWDAQRGFLSKSSHEIRTPMSGLLGMAELLAQTELSPEQHEILNCLRLSGSALLAAVDGVFSGHPSAHLHGEGIERGSLRPMRVLVAEDNVINQRVVQGFLQRQGHTVVLAANGQEALSMLRRQTIDLVLMDVRMPVLDGVTATKLIRQDTALKNIPVVGLTAYALNGHREQLLAQGMNGYVAKPFNSTELFSEMARVLECAEH